MTGPVRLLHVEDDHDIITIVRLSLEMEGGFDVRVARNLSDAVEILGDPAWIPDVTLLDVQLGAASGLDLLVRLNSERPGLPVIVMTASVSTDQINRYGDLGAAGVISKPFDPMTLASQVHARIHDHEAASAPDPAKSARQRPVIPGPDASTRPPTGGQG